MTTNIYSQCQSQFTKLGDMIPTQIKQKYSSNPFLVTGAALAIAGFGGYLGYRLLTSKPDVNALSAASTSVACEDPKQLSPIPATSHVTTQSVIEPSISIWDHSLPDSHRGYHIKIDENQPIGTDKQDQCIMCQAKIFELSDPNTQASLGSAKLVHSHKGNSYLKGYWGFVDGTNIPHPMPDEYSSLGTHNEKVIIESINTTAEMLPSLMKAIVQQYPSCEARIIVNDLSDEQAVKLESLGFKKTRGHLTYYLPPTSPAALELIAESQAQPLSIGTIN